MSRQSKEGKTEQGELKNMPKGSPMDKQARVVIEEFENLQKVADKLKDEKNKFLPLMKEKGKDVLNLQDKNGNNFEVKVTTSPEKISIRAKKEDML